MKYGADRHGVRMHGRLTRPHPTAPTSTPSSCASPNSKPSSARPAVDRSTRSGPSSVRVSRTSLPPSVATASGIAGTRPLKRHEKRVSRPRQTRACSPVQLVEALAGRRGRRRAVILGRAKCSVPFTPGGCYAVAMWITPDHSQQAEWASLSGDIAAPGPAGQRSGALVRQESHHDVRCSLAR